MLFAGHETTARLLFWASYLLTLAPEEQEHLRAEARAFAPEDVHALADLDRRPRTRQVLYEALRLYPPAPNLVREAVTDHEINGEPIRRGNLAWVVPFVLHRHRRFWSDPTAFQPDRFAGQASPWANSAYLPFGAGPRSCIGAAFALSEAQIVLSALLSRFRITLEGDRPVLPVGRVTLTPDHEPWFRLSPV
jgi:cytochrome P450